MVRSFWTSYVEWPVHPWVDGDEEWDDLLCDVQFPQTLFLLLLELVDDLGHLLHLVRADVGAVREPEVEQNPLALESSWHW